MPRILALCRVLLAGWLIAAAWPGAIVGAAEPHIFLDPDEIPAPSKPLDPAAMARSVTIYRDAYGVPHIDGPTDEAVIFGFAYAQAEDYFWQVEDSYILALGRYSEVHGSRGLNSDLLNHAFEIASTSKADFARIVPGDQSTCEAFAEGLNYYLATHPDVKPRLITHFEPWNVLAFGRHITLELCFRYTRLQTSNYLPRSNPRIWTAAGSNAWALGPGRTKSGNAMLMVNPHQPWFGFGQLYEAHLRSGEHWNFTGATFFGNPLPTLGHNANLGWAMTTNEPDIADLWRETFDDPKDPLHYRYDGGYRTATQWTDTIKVRGENDRIESRPTSFRKTHHGPVVSQEDGEHYLTARVGNLYKTVMSHQLIEMLHAENLGQFQAALRMMQFPYMNVIYADRDKNIFFLYNGTIPRRDAAFDWSKPVDGSDPRTEWHGFHTFDELPQVLNPPAGFIQNCNSTPFTTSDDGNPVRGKFPSYMVEDQDDDKRRAKMSRELLREMHDETFDQWRSAVFDNTNYWAEHELPNYRRQWEALKKTDAGLAAQVEPYLQHLLQWDCHVTLDSTAATLCTAWYEEMYGPHYPGETMKPEFEGDYSRQFQGLVHVADQLRKLHGDWRVKWGTVHRMQRSPNVADLVTLPFDDKLASLPSPGGSGPMGVILTTYYSPKLNIPLFRTLKKQYGLIGPTYLGAYEFGPRIEGASVLNFGESGDSHSPHFFDQASLLSERKLKPEIFYWDDVLDKAEFAYHPGETPQSLKHPNSERPKLKTEN